MKRLFILALRGYRYFLSPFMGNQCRFAPTCSVYAIEAVERFGPWRGGVLAVRRLARCHPWHAGGWDPVPERAVPGVASEAAGNAPLECGGVSRHRP